MAMAQLVVGAGLLEPVGSFFTSAAGPYPHALRCGSAALVFTKGHELQQRGWVGKGSPLQKYRMALLTAQAQGVEADVEAYPGRVWYKSSGTAAASDTENTDKVLPLALEGKEDRSGKTTSGVIIIGAIVGSFCLSTAALANFQSYDHAEMRGANMSGQDLTGAVFAACDCRKIDLSGSNLDGSTDTFAGFQGADLRNTSWIRAFADRVVFREANLQNANFTNAVLSGSQFDGADITGADFTDALIDNYQRLKMCKKAEGTNPVTGIETRESLFC